MPFRSFLLDQVAACERRMNQSPDPQEMRALTVVLEMWRTLLNESASMSPLHVTNEIAAIEEIQSALGRLFSADPIFECSARSSFENRAPALGDVETCNDEVR